MQSFQELKHIANSREGVGERRHLRVALLGDTATQLLSVAIRGMAMSRGLELDLYEAEYNQIVQQVLSPASELYAHCPEYTIVFQSTHKLLDQYAKDLWTPERINSLCEERLQLIRTLCSSAAGKVVCFNYPEIDDTVFGSYANKTEQSFSFLVRKLNYELMLLSQQVPNLFICDIAALQNQFGRSWLFSPSVYVATDMVLSVDALPYVASRVMDIICAIEGQARKCLILDLDNTIWGGVVGDDGWENLRIGHGLGIGKAYTEIQQWIKKLKNRGIIICVCSKNDESVAKEPFEKHPDMVLRLEDISVFVANWENKADNIRSIQQILHIGLDSMVFLDDNPAERAFVRRELPALCVPELPEDPADYLEYLYSLNLFETASYSPADQDRTQQYQAEALRTVSAQQFANEAAFLESLRMVGSVDCFNAYTIPRVAQLTQRSNQFNLRTIRYTEDQLTAIEHFDRYHSFAFSLADKFGDNGLVGVVILELREDHTAFVDTWLMSCRVLKRGMEDYMLRSVVAWMQQNEYRRLIGEYVPTPKNGMVRDFYPSLGFETVGENRYVLDIGAYAPRKCFIIDK